MRYENYMYPQCRIPDDSVEFLRAKVFARLHATRVGTESTVVALRVGPLIADLLDLRPKRASARRRLRICTVIRREERSVRVKQRMGAVMTSALAATQYRTQLPSKEPQPRGLTTPIMAPRPEDGSDLVCSRASSNVDVVTQVLAACGDSARRAI